MKIHLTMFLSCLLVMGCGSSEQKNVLLIPQPQTCEVQSGTYSFATGETFYSNLSGTDKSDLAAVLESSPFGLKASDDAQASFRFEQVDSLPGITSDEGYRLTVDKKGSGPKPLRRPDCSMPSSRCCRWPKPGSRRVVSPCLVPA